MTGRVHYAWVVAGAAFLVLVSAAGIRSTPGVLIVPLEDDFGWSRGVISSAVAVNLVLFGLAGPFAAAAMQRFGVRRVVTAGLVLLGTGAGATTVMTASWQLVLLWGVLVGAGSGALAPVFAATIAQRWFAARRGLVTGVLTAGSATGQLAFLPLLAWLASAYGWRTAATVVAVAAVSVIPVVLLVLRDFPRDKGLLPYGATAEPPVVTATRGPLGTAFEGLRLASRTRVFWLLAGSFFVCGATTNGLIGTHFLPAAHDHGIGEVQAAGLLALIGVFDIIGTTLSGWATDRFDPRVLLAWYYSLRGLSLLFLPLVLQTGSVPLLVFIVFYGLDWVATVPPTIALCAQVAGQERAPVVFGWVFSAHQLGAAFAAFGAGWVRAWSGTYTAAFLTAGLLCAVGAAMAFTVSRGRPRGRYERGRGLEPGVTPAIG